MAIMDSNLENNQYQYIQDTSLASLDSKTSPLAMLVRTCSQIGADPPMAAAAKSKKPATASVATAAVPDRPHSASPAAAYLGHAASAKHHRNHNNNYMEEPPKPVAKLNFKPYENTVLTPSTPPPAHQNHHANHQSLHNNNSHHHLHHLHNNSSSSISSIHNNNNNEDESRPKSSSSEDNSGGHGHGKKRKSASPRDDYHSTHKSSRRSSSSASSAEIASADPSTNPIIRSGLEVMHGSAAKAFCPPPPSMAAAAAHSPYKPADALAAFRHTYLPGGSPWMPAAVSLAAAAASKPSPTSGECKDPMCGGPATGCGQQQHHAAAAAAALAFASQYHPMMAAASGCPAGCGQCDHQRYLTSLMAAVPAFYAAPPPVAARPYTCSWVIPGGGGGGHSHPSATAAEAAAVPTLCGKSFGTSDELLQHIRTHTSGGSAGGLPLSMAAPGPLSPTTAAAFTAYNSHLSRHLFHHHHPSAVAAAYGKPSPPPSMMPPSPYSAFNPTAAYCYPPPSASAAAAYHQQHHHHHALYSPRGDTSAATVSR